MYFKFQEWHRTRIR